MYYICKHFKIQELVSPYIYNKFGSLAWIFFDTEVLKDLDRIREYHKMPIIINNWTGSGAFSQCGLRSNIDPLVKNKTTVYCSAHLMGKAFDLHSTNNIKLYEDVKTLIENGTLKAFRRLESPKSTGYGWVHVDSFRTQNDKLSIFV